MEVAIITGASFGLGEEFARQLAARKHNLLLVARSEERLVALAGELEQRYQIKAVALRCDLGEPGAAEKIAAYAKEHGLHPTWLVNNAGFGAIGALNDIDLTKTRGMMMVNMVSLVELTHLLLPEMRLGTSARIINVASTASFQPVPFFNVYAATKVFVLHFSEGLREELRNTAVRVLCLCPGPTPTNFAQAANIEPSVFDKGQSAADVVRMGLRASDANRTLLVCQRPVATILARLAPRWFVRRVAAFVAKMMLRKMGKG